MLFFLSLSFLLISLLLCMIALSVFFFHLIFPAPDLKTTLARVFPLVVLIPKKEVILFLSPPRMKRKVVFCSLTKKGSWTHELPSFPAQSAVMYFSFRGNQASSRFDHRFSAFDVSLKAFEISGQLIRLSLLDWRVLCCPGRANQPCNPIEEDHPLCILT